MLKLQTGRTLASVEQLRKLGLSRHLPCSTSWSEARADPPFVRAALAITDRRVAEGKPVAPSFLLACVLWSDVREGLAAAIRRERCCVAHRRGVRRIGDACPAAANQRHGLARSGPCSHASRKKPATAAPGMVWSSPRFRAAFDFMRLRADVGRIDEVLSWLVSQADDATRDDLPAKNSKAEQRRRVRSDLRVARASPLTLCLAETPTPPRRRAGERRQKAPTPPSQTGRCQGARGAWGRADPA